MSAARRKAAPSLAGDYSRVKAGAASTAARVNGAVRDAIAAEPLVAVGAAAGLGFLLGGGLSRASAKGLLGVGARLAGAWLAKEFLENPSTQE